MKSFDKILSRICPAGKIGLDGGGFDDRVQVGVDIGAGAIKVVQARKTGAGLSFLKVGCQEIGGESDGVLPGASDEKIAAALKAVLGPLGIKTRDARLVISDPAVYLRHIRVPLMTDNELVKSIKWLAEKNTPFAMEDAIVDFQVLREKSPRDDQQMDVVIVAVEKKVIDRYVTILKSGRLAPTRIDIPAFAIAKTLITSYTLPQKEMAAMIDIGAQTMSVVIAKEDSLLFARYVPWGGALLTQALMRELNVGFGEAEKIKTEFSFSSTVNPDPGQSERIAGLFGPLLAEAVNQINRCFAYCERELMTDKIHKVYLCGGTAALGGLDQYLARSLGVIVERANVYKKFPAPVNRGQDPASARPAEQFIAAAGILF